MVATPITATDMASQVRKATRSPSTRRASTAIRNGPAAKMKSVLATVVLTSAKIMLVKPPARKRPPIAAVQPAARKAVTMRPRRRNASSSSIIGSRPAER